MKILNLVQGSPEWHAHRASARNASDAPAIMGASPYVTRAELIRQKATGIVPEVDAKTQAVFNRGHEVEPLLRALAEKMIGDELYPAVATSDDGYLSASLDGATMDERVIFEAKQSNTGKVIAISEGRIPSEDKWQIVQQMAICESAEKCLYLVGDGEEDGTYSLVIRRAEIETDITALRAAWAQFDADVAAYVPEPVKVVPVAAPVESFGALSLRVEGRVLASNLDDFRADSQTFIARLPKPSDLKTDQDFVNAKAAIKACEEAESRIESAIANARAQMSDVDTVFRVAEEESEKIRAARLTLDKVVKAEEQNRKVEIANNAAFQIGDFYAKLNANMAVGVVLADPRPSIAAAIKGLRTIKSIEDAAAQVVANAKIAASAEAERHRANLALLEKAGRPELFADRDVLVRSKQPDDLRNLVATRIADADKREQQRLEAERERIRKEEEAKAKSESMKTTGTPVLPADVAAPAAAVTNQGTAPVAAERQGKRAPIPVMPELEEIIRLVANRYQIAESLAKSWITTLTEELH